MYVNSVALGTYTIGFRITSEYGTMDAISRVGVTILVIQKAAYPNMAYY